MRTKRQGISDRATLLRALVLTGSQLPLGWNEAAPIEWAGEELGAEAFAKLVVGFVRVFAAELRQHHVEAKFLHFHGQSEPRSGPARLFFVHM